VLVNIIHILAYYYYIIVDSIERKGRASGVVFGARKKVSNYKQMFDKENWIIIQSNVIF